MVKPMLLNEDNLSMDILLDKERLSNYVNQNYKGWIYQIKYNGVRGVVSVKNGKITAIRDRNDNPILQNYPELKGLNFSVSEGLFDVEIVILDDSGKSHFYNEYDEDKKIKQAGIQLRSLSIKGSDIVKKYPVSLVIFDVLKLDDELLITKPYAYRYEKLSKVIDSDRVKVIKNYTDFDEIWNKVISEDLEGIAIKNPLGVYEIDTRSLNCIKLKNYKVVNVKVEESESNDRGLRITGITDDEDKLNVSFQFAGISNVEKDSFVKIKYLEKIGGFGGRLTQPTIAK